MFNLINRIRHYRGFGVHSPLAYAFITEILRQHYSYYAYPGIRVACRDYPARIHRLARLLHRIAARHNFAAYRVSADVPPPLHAAIEMAWHKPKGNAVLSVVTGASDSPSPMHDDGSITLFLNTTEQRALEMIGNQPTGILLAGLHDCIYFASDRMPFTTYKVLI